MGAAHLGLKGGAHCPPYYTVYLKSVGRPGVILRVLPKDLAPNVWARSFGSTLRMTIRCTHTFEVDAVLLRWTLYYVRIREESW